MDPSMITIPSVGQYAADYEFTTPTHDGNERNFTNFFVFVIKSNLTNGLLIDENPFPTSTVYNPIIGTEYVSGFIHISAGNHVIRHTSPIVAFLGLLIGKVGDYESYGFPLGMRLASLDLVRLIKMDSFSYIFFNKQASGTILCLSVCFSVKSRTIFAKHHQWIVDENRSQNFSFFF